MVRREQRTHVFGIKPLARAVKPTRSAKRTVTTFRSSRRCRGPSSTAAPQKGQKGKLPGRLLSTHRARRLGRCREPTCSRRPAVVREANSHGLVARNAPQRRACTARSVTNAPLAPARTTISWQPCSSSSSTRRKRRLHAQVVDILARWQASPHRSSRQARARSSFQSGRSSATSRHQLHIHPFVDDAKETQPRPWDSCLVGRSSAAFARACREIPHRCYSGRDTHSRSGGASPRTGFGRR